jgi:hypothetical protein
VEASHQTQRPQCQRRSYQPRQPCATFYSSPALPSSGPSFTYGHTPIPDLAHWFHCSHLRSASINTFTPAKRIWVDRVWDTAKQSPLVLGCVSLSMILKKDVMVGGVDSGALYWRQQSFLIQQLREALESRGRIGGGGDEHVMLTIAMLAELESRRPEGLEAARMHLNALNRLAHGNSSGGLGELAWVVAMRVDLRQALWGGREPILPIHLSTTGHDQNFLVAQLSATCLERCARQAALNYAQLPNSLADARTLDLFTTMHRISAAWDALLALPSPPIKLAYSLASSVRHSVASLKSSTTSYQDQIPTRLTLIALQLHIWILTRYWVPQNHKVQAQQLHEAFSLLSTSDDLVFTWVLTAHLSSLLWTLMTLATARFDMCSCHNRSPLNRLLISVFSSLSITSFSTLRQELEKWPWLESWHAPRVELVWAEICRVSGRCEEISLSSAAAGLAVACLARRQDHREWFLGGLEFYCSL